MKCQRCGVEAAIMGTRFETSGDSSAETQTEVWVVQEYQCRNPRCGNYATGGAVGEERQRIYPERAKKECAAEHARA